jgi:hypothetical protein
MAYYCRDCVTWINSKDANRYGEKWCDYDRKYRSADQKIYDCRGFVWAKRSIITKVCEILGIDPKPYFDAFDDTKEIVLIPSCVDKLIDYNTVGPVIAEKLDSCEKKEQVATNILDTYIKPAYEKCLEKDYQAAVTLYEHMVKVLAIMFNATKESLKETRMFDDLLNVGPLMDNESSIKM